MNRPFDPNDLRALPVSERLQLIEDLWDSIEAESEALPLSDWHRAEIDRRLDALESGTSIGSSWPDVRDRILRKP